MTTNSIWDDPEMQVTDDYARFVNPGDSVSGIVQTVRVYRFDDGSPAPQLVLQLDDGQQRIVTAGAIRLKSALIEQRPEVGDRLTVTLTGDEQRGGGKTLRYWDVRVDKTGGQPAQAPTPQQQAPAPAAPVQQPQQPPAQDQATADAAAALANLTPEQRQALGL